ncbi:MAG: hypothetical protein E3J72_01590 [Planctomycetota bacterium]|nr:MAG: hypothetical protein E3J72_01590 [Planctomycetota bacterium]
MTNKMIIGLLCVVIVLLVGVIFSLNREAAVQPAHAGGFGGADSGFIMVTGADAAANSDVLYILDTKERTLLVYGLDRRGIQLKSARTVKYDLYLDEWEAGKQDPSYKKIKDATKRKWAPTEDSRKKRK